MYAYWFQASESMVQISESRVHNSEPWIRILNPVFRLQDPGLGMLNPGFQNPVAPERHPKGVGREPEDDFEDSACGLAPGRSPGVSINSFSPAAWDKDRLEVKTPLHGVCS